MTATTDTTPTRLPPTRTAVGGATPLPAPRAARLRRPGWRDPRLLLGLALVGASVLLGSWAVGTAGRTVPVVVAREALVPGQVLTADDLDVHEVGLARDGAAYVGPGAAAGLVVTRTVGAGELVPWSAVAAEADLAVRPLALRPTAALSRAVVAGARVDLWWVPQDPSAGTPESRPQVLVEGVTVAEVAQGTAAFTVGDGVTVHVLVPVDRLPDVLAALAGDGSVEVVPVPGGATR